MNIFSKRSLWTLLIISLVLVLGWFGLRWTVNNYITTHSVEKRISNYTNREVRIGRFSVSLIDGIKLVDFSISNHPDFKQGEFIKAEQIYLSPDWLSLIFGSIHFSTVRLEKATLHLNRNASGSWNFNQGFEPSKSSTGRSNGRNPNGLSLGFSIGNLSLTNGQIHLKDQINGYNTVATCQEINLSQFIPGEESQLRYEGLKWESLSSSGTAEIRLSPIEASLTDVRLDVQSLSDFEKYLPETLTNRLERIDGSLKSTFESIRYSTNTISGTGQIHLNNLNIDLSGRPEIPVTNITTKTNISYDRESKIISGTLTDPSADSIKPSGRIVFETKPPFSKPTLSITTDLKDISVSPVMDKIESIVEEKYTDKFELSGSIDRLQLNLAGEWPNLSYGGSANIKNLSVDHELLQKPMQFSSITTTLRDNHNLQWKAETTQFDGPLSFEGTIKNILDENQRLIDSNVSGQSIDLNSITKIVSTDRLGLSKEFSLSGTLSNVDLQVEGKLLDPDIRGTVSGNSIESMNRFFLTKPITISSLQATLKKNHELEFEMRSNEFNGQIAASGSVDNYLNYQNPHFELNASGHSINIETVLNAVKRDFHEQLKNLEATGSVSKFNLRANGSIKDPSYQFNSVLKSASLRSNLIPSRLEQLTGHLYLTNKILKLTDFSGVYENEKFRTDLKIPIPFDLQSNFSFTGTVNKFPVESILKIDFIRRTIPDGYDMTGLLTLESARIQGPLNEVDLQGTAEIIQGTFQSPHIDGKVKDLYLKTQSSGRKINIKELQGNLFGSKITGSGEIAVSNDPNVDLSLSSKNLKLGTVMKNVKIIPSLPSGWSPNGVIESDIKLTGSVTDPSLSGSATSKKLTIGQVQLEDVKTTLRYSDRVLKINNLDGGLYNGTTSLTGSIDFSKTEPRLQLEGRIDSLHIRPVLTTFTKIGKESAGSVSGTVEASGPLTDYKHYSGSVNLKGKAIKLREVQMFSNLTHFINNSVVRMIVRIQQFGSAAQEEWLSSEASTQFDTVIARASFDQGLGDVRKLTLENDDLKLEGDGRLWLDGRIDLKLSLTPKSDLLNQFDQKWIATALADGLPPIKIEGRLNNPKFNQEGFRDRLIENIVNFRFRKLQNNIQEKSNEILKELFSE